MANKFDIQSQIDAVELELRSLREDVKNTEKEVNVDEVRSKMKELETKRGSLIKELAECDKPVEQTETRTALFDAEELRKLAKGELRSITIGTDGGSVGVGKIFEQVAVKDDLLAQADIQFGKDALTKIPVILPLGDLTSSTEGTTSVTVDTDAGISITELNPRAYPRVLPVSAEALTVGVVDIENRMQGIFDKAFRKAMHKGMIVGAGTSGDAMEGIFTNVNNAISAATSAGDYPERVLGIGTSAALTVAKLAELAIKVGGLDEEYTIVLSPSVYGALMSDSSTDDSTKLYKETLIRDKSIENVKVVVDAYAPATTDAAKKTLAVAAPLGRYEIGVVKAMQIDVIKTAGDKNTYFQAIPFFDGKKADSRDLYAIARNPS